MAAAHTTALAIQVRWSRWVARRAATARQAAINNRNETPSRGVASVVGTICRKWMAPMASKDTTAVARRTVSLALADCGLVGRCLRTARLVMGCRMDMCSGSLSDGPAPGLPED